MSYRPLRKDLTETSEKCAFCSRYLKSLKAYVLQDIKTGEVVFSGPDCAKKNLAVGHSLKGIPDLTKFTSATASRSSTSSGGGNTGTRHTDIERQSAIEYLCLRESKLSSMINCSYPVLANYYQEYLKGELSEDAIRHIKNIEKKTPESLKLGVLQKCYNYVFWIDIAISRLDEDKRSFLNSIRRTVLARKNLSTDQFISLNAWLKNIDGVPQLK